MKEECFVFDFAPDRTLKVLTETVHLSRKPGKSQQKRREAMTEFLNFCPVIAISGSKTKKYSVESMMEQIEDTVKKAIELFGKGARTLERVFYGFFEEQKDGIHESLQNMATIKGRDNRHFVDSLRSIRNLLKNLLFYISELEPIDALKD
jgi:hypothetical protein